LDDGAALLCIEKLVLHNGAACSMCSFVTMIQHCFVSESLLRKMMLFAVFVTLSRLCCLVVLYDCTDLLCIEKLVLHCYAV